MLRTDLECGDELSVLVDHLYFHSLRQYVIYTYGESVVSLIYHISLAYLTFAWQIYYLLYFVRNDG